MINFRNVGKNHKWYELKHVSIFKFNLFQLRLYNYINNNIRSGITTPFFRSKTNGLGTLQSGSLCFKFDSDIERLKKKTCK